MLTENAASEEHCRLVNGNGKQIVKITPNKRYFIVLGLYSYFFFLVHIQFFSLKLYRVSLSTRSTIFKKATSVTQKTLMHIVPSTMA